MSTEHTPESIDEIRNAIFQGRKIEAIKLYRESSGAGLKEAKDFVELLEKKLREAEPDLFMAPPAAKGCGMMIVVLLVLGILSRELFGATLL